jgi:hypothetical protein
MALRNHRAFTSRRKEGASAAVQRKKGVKYHRQCVPSWLVEKS